MLVLSRKYGGKIYIGKDIVITIVGIDGGKVKVGITAPGNTEIWREEILPLDHPSRLLQNLPIDAEGIQKNPMN